MKRIASVLALLGCLLHATLLPWHAAYAKGAAASTAVSEAAQLAQDLLIICHSDGTFEAQGAAQSPAEKQQQQAECLLCKGIMGFQLVVLAAAEIGLLAPPPAERFSLVSDAVHVDGISIAPRSRGPPLPV